MTIGRFWLASAIVGPPEVLTAGILPEDCWPGGIGLKNDGVTAGFMRSVGEPRRSGTGILSAWAIAIVIAVALGKRALGSLAREREMTDVKAGGMRGLIRFGEVGVELICCVITATGVSP